MNTRLTRISPGDMARLLGLVGFIVSVPVVLFAFLAIGHGRTIHMKGFVTLTFKDSLDPVALVLAFPLLNGIAGVLVGFITAWLYNGHARLFGGVSIRLDRINPPSPNPPMQRTGGEGSL